MKISDLATRTGLTAHTIRYYERIGLMPAADRDSSGHRAYDERTLVWVEFLGHLKTTGMPIRDMLDYARLRAAGAGTEGRRKAMLAQHRAVVAQRVVDLNECLDVLDAKIAGYGD
ncbi:MAG: MerR family transcriptional regulator [Alphaproteobacteria bacterium]|nr:MerR family transcriptional regulator [Alphaproteobacteria bacterium]